MAGGLRHTFHCPMRWSDMDAYGHVNNVVYLTYLEEARVDMLFTLGAELGAKALSEGVLVARHEIDYRRPLVYHPRGVDIDLWTGAIKGASFEIRYEVHDDETRVRPRGVAAGALRPDGAASPAGERRGARLPRALPPGPD